MPRYHFPIVNGVRLTDPVGIELKDAEQAKHQAEVIAEHLAGASKKPRNVVVETDNGTEIYKKPVKRDGPND